MRPYSKKYRETFTNYICFFLEKQKNINVRNEITLHT